VRLMAGRFAVVGDLQETSRIEFWREDNAAERALLIRRIAEEKPSFVVLLGDLVFDGSSARHWKRFDALVAPLAEARVPMVPILGNHDYWWGKAKNLRHYDERFPELAGNRWHRRRFESLELVFLDSNVSAQSRSDRQEQIQWFARVLDEADRDAACRGTLVFVHHPPFTNSSVSRGSAVVRRFFLRPFMSAKKTQAMVSGHVHSYERFEQAGKTFLVSGGGGGPRVRLFAERRRRHPDLYRAPSGSRRPCHYLLVGLIERALSVEVIGLEKGCASFATMEAFELDLSPAGDFAASS
jgi:3',5'-cyclic AMP phosphodiesterase CpdA